ncbi:hypothetical protein [Budvicia aquatica]|uniref:Uncharacterized protein n=1 Tax=Budvicia aquatica TaxID=82979 RepID=A0A2C6DKD1_9GAMM|nr:hypothetical protein [Budvicia aquatica]PHI29153.1 hypothetical protein CRN84_07375 [Budvicia aquatica]VFS47334.1 Uncharacterised protein [Budvicia aquatica]
MIQTKHNADYVLRRHDVNYEKNMAWFRQALGPSRFFENGQMWKNHKKLTQPYLNNFSDIDTITLTKHHGQQALHQLARGAYTGKITLDDNVLKIKSPSPVVGIDFNKKDLAITAFISKIHTLYKLTIPQNFIDKRIIPWANTVSLINSHVFH